MHAVKAQQMGIGLDRAQIIDRHDLDIAAVRFDDGAQHIAPDPTKPVDGDLDGHDMLSRLSGRRGRHCRERPAQVDMLPLTFAL